MLMLSENQDLNDVRILNEGKENNKKYYIEGVFMQANVLNGNNRIYPLDVMEDAVDVYVRDYVNKNRALGELDHPAEPNMDFRNVSHIIEKLQVQGSNVYGRARIMEEMPQGKVAAGLIKEGVQLAVSSRGLGTLTEDDKGRDVVSDFVIVAAADIVVTPSAPDAFVTALSENRNWVFDACDRKYKLDKVERMRDRVREMPAREVNEKRMAIINSYLRTL